MASHLPFTMFISSKDGFTTAHLLGGSLSPCQAACLKAMDPPAGLGARILHTRRPSTRMKPTGVREPWKSPAMRTENTQSKTPRGVADAMRLRMILCDFMTQTNMSHGSMFISGEKGQQPSHHQNHSGQTETPNVHKFSGLDAADTATVICCCCLGRPSGWQ